MDELRWKRLVELVEKLEGCRTAAMRIEGLYLGTYAVHPNPTSANEVKAIERGLAEMRRRVGKLVEAEVSA